MPSALPIFSGLTSSERSAALDRAARALTDDGLVVLPTETVYGVAARVGSVRAVERFAALPRPGVPSDPSKPWSGRPAWTWHAGGVDQVRAAFPNMRPIHRRLLDRLSPGPARFLFELSVDEANAASERIGAVPGVLIGVSQQSELRTIGVRVPSHEITSAVLAAAGRPIVIERLSRFGWGDDPSEPGFMEKSAAAGVGVVLDDGPTGQRRSSTSIVLHERGYRIAEVGAISERAVKRAAVRRVLFVCTGNTCRSPMAAAIAQHLLSTEPTPTSSGIETIASSAGVAASDGQPATPEGMDAIHLLGIASSAHRSKQLTRAMIEESEVVFVMTGSHREAVLSLDRSAESKMKLLDPSGRDIPDPFGGPPSVYAAAAQRLVDAVRRRLMELDSGVGVEKQQ